MPNEKQSWSANEPLKQLRDNVLHQTELDARAGVNKEGRDMSAEHLHPINAQCHGCMDGRPVLFKAQNIDGVWTMVLPGEQAAEVVEAKLPGGALGFIAVLEKFGNVDQETAISITEKALRGMGMEPQLHIDNDHGHFAIEGKSETELLSFVETQTGGCGFAGRTWGEQAPVLVNSLKDKGWLVEVLDGHHDEGKAIVVDKQGMAIDTKQATEAHQQAFTFNRPETTEVLQQIQTLLAQRGIAADDFVHQSMEWYNNEFPAIADALRGIKSTQSVK